MSRLLKYIFEAFSKALFFCANKLGRRCNCDAAEKPVFPSFCGFLLVVSANWFALHDQILRSRPSTISRHFLKKNQLFNESYFNRDFASTETIDTSLSLTGKKERLENLDQANAEIEKLRKLGEKLTGELQGKTKKRLITYTTSCKNGLSLNAASVMRTIYPTRKLPMLLTVCSADIGKKRICICKAN